MHPIFIEIGPVVIRYYGLLHGLAVVAAFWLISREVKRTSLLLSRESILDLFLVVIPASYIGARIYFVAFHWNFFRHHPLEIFAIWHGGLAIHGGIIGGIIALALFCRWKGIRFWAMADIIAPSLILGQALGRLGNFLNGDAHGLPTALPWGIVFPPGSPAGMQFPGIPIHPSMLYQMILNLLVFWLLWRIRAKGYKEGFIVALYFVLSATARFFVSFTRADSLWVGPLRAAHIASAVLIIIFAGLIIVRRLYQRNQTANFSPR
jgi:phosphatidylglycerol:prolipoprotein diacylglycerol transferase